MTWMHPIAQANPRPDGLRSTMVHVSTLRRFWFVPLCAMTVLLMVLAYDTQARGNIGVPDKLKLISQLRAGQYQVLENYLTNLQDRYEAGDTPEYYVSIGFNAFGNSGHDR